MSPYTYYTYLQWGLGDVLGIKRMDEMIDFFVINISR